MALLAATAIALSNGVALANYQLNILHINDVHSRLGQINKYDSTCSDEEAGKSECFGGIARVKTAIDMRRSALKGANVLVLDADIVDAGQIFGITVVPLPFTSRIDGEHGPNDAGPLHRHSGD